MTRWIVVLCGILLATPSRADVPLDFFADEHLAPPIAWLTTWRETLDHNVQVWREDLSRRITDEKQRNRALAARELALVDAVAQRFARDREAQAHVLRRRAVLWRELDIVHRQSPEAFEQVAAALADDAEALATLLLAYGAQGGRDADSLRRRERAYAGLVQLVRKGAITPTDTRLIDAALSLQAHYRNLGWFIAAREVLAGIDMTQVHRRVPAFDAQAALLWTAGDGAAANAMRKYVALLGLSDERAADLVARHRRAYEEAYIPSPPPLVASSGPLFTRIEQVLRPDAVQREASADSVLAHSPYDASLVALTDRRYASAWTALHAVLRDRSPGVVAALRQLQQSAAPTAPLADADDATLMATFRRHPWSGHGVEAMLMLGERALWRGHVQTARRCFEDVLAFADSDDARRRATRGLELAGTIASPAPADAPLRGRPLALQLPDAPLWPTSFMRSSPDELLRLYARLGATMTAFDGGVIVVSPGLLARYDATGAQPRWLHRQTPPPSNPGDLGREVIAPAPVRATVSAGRVFARWGMDPARRYLAHVAAFDLDSGVLQWTTQDDPAWDALWPISDPVEADGRLFVLAMAYEAGRRPLLAPLELACLDAATGATLWRRPIGANSPELVLGTRIGSGQVQTADVTHYGARVAVHDGAVYCSTSMSMLARLDLRDGLIEWIRHDEGISVNENWPLALRREGARPTVVGDLLIVAPRDMAGLMAIDRRTGKLRWQDRNLPSNNIIGSRGSTVLVHDDAHVAAVAVADGRVVWSRRFDAGLDTGPLQHGDRVHVAAGGRIQTLDADSGRTIGDAVETGVSEGDRVWTLGAAGGRYVAITGEPAGFAPLPRDPAAPTLQAAAARRPQLPLDLAWEITRTRPMLYPAAAPGDMRVAMVSDSLLEMVDPRSPTIITWRRRVAPDLRELIWTRRHLMLIHGNRIVAVDQATGNVAAEHYTGYAAPRWHLTPSLLIVFEHARHNVGRAGVTAIELDSGHVRWQRELIGVEWWWIQQATHAGDRIILNCLRGQYANFDPVTVYLDASNGRLLPGAGAVLRLRRTTEGHAYNGMHILAYMPRQAYRIDPADNSSVDLKARFTSDVKARDSDIVTSGPWTMLRHFRTNARNQDFNHWTFRLDDPQYVFHSSEGDGRIVGDRLFLHSDNKLQLVDLPSKKLVATYELPGPRDQNRRTMPLDRHIDGDRIFVGSAMLIARSQFPERTRVDQFDLHSGELQQSQVLPATEFMTIRRGQQDTHWRRTQFVWAGGVLLVTHANGLQAYVPVSESRPMHVPVVSGEVIERIDGKLDDWPDNAKVSLQQSVVDGAELRLAAHGGRLFAAVTLPRPDPLSARGAGVDGGGDRLDVAISDGRASTLRLSIAVKPDGVTHVSSTARRDLTDDARFAVHHDPVTGRLTYELAINYSGLRQRGDTGTTLDMSLAAWGPHDGKPDVMLTRFGGGLDATDHMPLRHQVLHMPE
jgi:outer membrane protein assembly factor BamB